MPLPLRPRTLAKSFLSKSFLSRLSAKLIIPILFLTFVVVPPIFIFDPLHRRISQISFILPFQRQATFVNFAQNLTRSALYRHYYDSPSHDILRIDFLNLLDSAIRTASAEPVPFEPIQIIHAQSIEPKLAKYGYVHDDKPVNPLCFPSSKLRPAVCLSTIANSVFTTSGTAINLNSSTVYEISGGCCVLDWKTYLNKSITFSPHTYDTVASNNGRAVLVLNQHHGSTFHHVIHEIVSRYLLVLPLLEANPEIIVAVDRSDIAPTILSILGLPPYRLIEFKSLHHSLWTFGSLLLFPPPVYKHEHLGFFPKNQTKVTAQVLRHVVERDSPVEVHNSSLPVLVLMERAIERKKDGSCSQTRCAKNFDQLKLKLRQKLNQRMDIVIFKAAENLRTSISIFSAASVVVGIHGAGFQNVMFCEPGTTVLHIGWDAHYRSLVEQFDLLFHQVDVPEMRRDHKNIVLDVDYVVDSVIKAIEQDKVISRHALVSHDTLSSVKDAAEGHHVTDTRRTIPAIPVELPATPVSTPPAISITPQELPFSRTVPTAPKQLSGTIQNSSTSHALATPVITAAAPLQRKPSFPPSQAVTFAPTGTR